MTAHRLNCHPFIRIVSLLLVLTTIVSLFPAQVKAQPMPSAMLTAPHLSPELSRDRLPGVGADGLAEGILINPYALQSTTQGTYQPDVLENPISVSRVQSAATAADAAGGILTITFTVRNNLQPVLAPDIPASASIQERSVALAAFDATADPNTVHDIVLVDALTSHATFISASPFSHRSASEHIWNLGNLAPSSSVAVSLTLQISADSAIFTALDTGATARGMLRGRFVTAQSSAAGLAPNDMRPWLVRTLDADTQDQYMLARVAEIGADPDHLLAYLHTLGYESYSGSLRGTRGAVWSAAGNALDKSSLLIAMLRSSGTPARYRHGRLSVTRAQELIHAMFPTPPGVTGHIPPGEPLSDPANDPRLLMETRDHWWVEAYYPGEGWRDLDPTFTLATPGQTFVESVASDGTDRIAELPSTLRHSVFLQLRVEEYSLLADLGATTPNDLRSSYPLSATFATVELVGNPVTLGHLVSTDQQGGLLLSLVTHTYHPYVVFKDLFLKGDAFQELRAGSALGAVSNNYITGEWLQIETRAPDGHVKQYQRELFDLLGFNTRYSDSNVEVEVKLPVSATQPTILPDTIHQIASSPSWVPADAANQYIQTALMTSAATAQAANQVHGVRVNSPDSLFGVYPLAPAEFGPPLPVSGLTADVVVAQDAANPDGPATTDGCSPLSNAAAIHGKIALIDRGTCTFLTKVRNAQHAGAVAVLVVNNESGPPVSMPLPGGDDGVDITIPAIMVGQEDGTTFKQAASTINATLTAAPDESSAAQAIQNFSNASFAVELANASALLYAYHAFHSESRAQLDTILLTHSYADSPGIVFCSFIDGPGAQPGKTVLTTTFDLLDDSVRVIARPGQAVQAERTYRTSDGMQKTVLEGAVLREYLKQPETSTLSAVDIIEQAQQNGIALHALTSDDLDRLATLAISEEARARITATLQQGKYVLVPAEMVTLGTQTTIAWYEFDPQTGDFIGVLEDGSHGVLVEYLGNIIGTIRKKEGLGKWSKINVFILGFYWGIITKAISKNVKGPLPKTLAGAIPDGINISLGANTLFKIGALAGGAVTNAALDPPLFPWLTSTSVDVAPRTTASATVSRTASHSGSLSTATLTAPGTTLHGAIQANWTSSAQSSFALTSLSVSNATLIDAYGTTLATGAALQATPRFSTTLVLAQGTPLSTTLTGIGDLSFYAPAVNGTGAGGSWQSYTAQLGAAQPYTLLLRDALISTADNTHYTGDFRLEVTGNATITGYGATAVPGFGSVASIQATSADIWIGPSSGAVQVGGQPVNVPNGLALVGYTGALSIAEENTTTDRIALSGAGGTISAPFFTLAADPAASTTPPSQPVTFQAVIVSNRTDTYTLTAEAPENWNVDIAPTGQVTAIPPIGTTPGSYQILLTAQSTTDPALFVAAVHTVTTTDEQGMVMRLSPDPFTTVPWGEPEAHTIAGDTNNGQLQLPDAAFTVDITNTSTVAHTFALTITGLPEEWLILSAAEGQSATTLTLPAGGFGRVGLYISPTLTTLPPAGTAFPFNVQAAATDSSRLSQNVAGVFTVPAIAYGRLDARPEVIFSAPGNAATFDLSLRNVGSVAGTLPLAVTPPTSTWTVTGLTAPVTLDRGQENSQHITLHTPTGTPGQPSVVAITSQSGAYTQTRDIVLHMVTERALCAYRAGQAIAETNGDVLAAALFNLGQQIDALDPDLMNAAQHEQVTDAIRQLANQLASVAGVRERETALRQLILRIGAAVTVDDMSDSLTDLCTTLDPLPEQWATATQFAAIARFVPGAVATRVGEQVSFALQLVNRGTRRNSYRVVFGGTGSASQALAGLPAPQTVTLDPGQSQEIPLLLTPSKLGLATIHATITAVDTGGNALDFSTRATSSLNVVETLVRVLSISGVPDFVETQNSQTTIVAQIANVANIARTVTASTRLLGPDGQEVWTENPDFNLRLGNPFSYTLGTINTAGFASGVYTITVDLHNEANVPIPGGAGYGYLIVGEGLALSHAVQPAVVAPGTVEATTIITTQVRHHLRPLVGPAQTTTTNQSATTNDERAASHDQPATMGDQSATTGDQQTSGNQLWTINLQLPAAVERPALAAEALASTTGITRYEESEASIVYSGTWELLSNTSQASGGQSRPARVAGSFASLVITGTWASLGLATGSDGGEAEVFIDGVSQGIVDTYSRERSVASHVYPGLGEGTHTISLTVLGSSNPFASDTRVRLDYVDVWDGTALPEGTFEQDSVRVFRSDDWFESTDTDASGGTYFHYGSNAWFPFTGDSVSVRLFPTYGEGQVHILIDGQSQGVFDLHSTNDISRTFAFNNLGDGPHVVQVQSYRDTATVDAFSTPGAPPFFTPSVRTGVIRYEEDDPSMRYNGIPLDVTADTWDTGGFNPASSGYAAYSDTPGDTASISFSGRWTSIGFVTDSNGGQTEVFIDGISQGIVDTYSREQSVASRVYPNLGAGMHTISCTVLNASNPLDSDTHVHLDYVDVWDGTTLPDGTFEQNDARIYRSAGWFESNDAAASGGSYIRDGRNVWFPFIGNTLSVRTFASFLGGRIHIVIDGQEQGTFDLYSTEDMSRTFSFNNLGAGPHIGQVQSYRGTATVDAFSTPGEPPFFAPAVRMSVTRFEEDDPTLLYNGAPLAVSSTSWRAPGSGFRRASGGYAAQSDTPGDTVSLTFSGAWASIGFLTDDDGGQAEVFLDGVSQGIVDTYAATQGVTTTVFANLISDTHTISCTILGTASPASTGSEVYLDYIDAWDGTPLPQGRFEQDDARVYLSNNWSEVARPGRNSGSYIQDGSHAWFHFTGDTVTVIAMTSQVTPTTEVFIDGVSQGIISPTYALSPSPVPISYTHLGAGVHVIQITNIDQTALDAFDTSATPVHGGPMVEWYVTPVDGSSTTPAIGDINGDGIVELVATTQQGMLNVYRGDGADTGNGSPLLWGADLKSPLGFDGGPESPLLVDLDGKPGAEIVVGSQQGLYAFHNDGTLLWYTDTIHGGSLSATAAANLDDDPAPELVAPGEDGIYVVKADGSIASYYEMYALPTPVVLADLTGDAKTDILVASANTLYLFDYAPITPTLVWSRTHTGGQSYGAPAVADVDGVLAGGDPGPEIVMGWDGEVELLDADGSQIWYYSTGGKYPSSVTIGDTNGDGSVEIIFYMKVTTAEGEGHIYVLEPDGSLLWDTSARDLTLSSSGVSVLDLDGDGAWEVIWNGSRDGLTILRGSDGKVLFNEPLINSRTIQDYPVTADLDGDGHTEIVAVDPDGIYIIGFDSDWGPARPLWNGYDYHITNINDDLSVPTVEAPSWLVHNTYRTQTALLNPVPIFEVTLNHTLPVSGVVVLSETFSAPPDQPAPNLRWSYRQGAFDATRVTSFAARLTNMRAGEVRAVSTGTVVRYQLPSGMNRLTLPPLFVAATHILTVAPLNQTAPAGSTVHYQVTLVNPGTTATTYTLGLSGLPEGWAALPEPVQVPAGGQVTVPFELHIPLDAQTTSYTFAVDVTDGAGGVDQVQATLVVTNPRLLVAVTPPLIEAGYGQTVTYTVTITNLEATSRTYTLNVSGLEESSMSLPGTVQVPAQGHATVPLSVTALAAQGFYPFAVTAQTSGGSGQGSAALRIIRGTGVQAALTPPTAWAGIATSAAYTVTITNTGNLPDSYDLAVQLPTSGWSGALLANGVVRSSVQLSPYVFNVASLQLLISPPAGIAPGTYPISVTATSRTDPDTVAVANGQVVVAPQGVSVNITPDGVTMNPDGSQTWDVKVTNTGTQADTFDLTTGGSLSINGRLSSNEVTLQPGASTVVPLTAGPFTFALPQDYNLVVTARSQTMPQVVGYDMTSVRFAERNSVGVLLNPVSITLTDAFRASYLVIITNTSNLDDRYALTATADSSEVQLHLERSEVHLPVLAAAGLRLDVQVVPPLSKVTSVPGTNGGMQQQRTYTLTLHARSLTSTTVTGADVSTLTILVNQQPARVYLPFVQR